MTFQYAFVYLIVNIVCVLSALVILTRLNSSIGSDTENKIFRFMIFSYMAFLFCEILWILSDGGFIDLGGYAEGAIKIAGTMFIPIMVYFWLQYAETRFDNPRANTRRFKLLTAIPLIIMLIIYFSSIWTHAVGVVDETTGEITPGPAIAITGLVDNIYGVAVVIHAIILLVRDKEGFKRKEYLSHILFIVICTAGGITDAAVSGTPIMPMAIMLSFNVLFIILQETKIFNDALTGLNNRRLADRYLTEAIAETGEEKPMCVIMMDIDDFKLVNDRYGHLEGDKALVAVSDALKKTMDDYRGFLARWGGDEFVIALTDVKDNTIDSFKTDLKKELELSNGRIDLPVELALSMGQEMCYDKNRSLADVIAKADEALYLEKAKKNVGAGRGAA